MNLKEKINKIRNSKDDIVKHVFSDRIINRIFLEVCSLCQYGCKFCTHEEMKKIYKGYSLTLEELDRFLYYTKKSRYYLREVCLHGPGEPTLWEHLNEGIKILYDSDVVGGISIVSNGVSIENIKEETVEYMYKIHISDYPCSKENERLISLQKRFPEKISINDRKIFKEFLDRAHLGTIPCECICHFPALIGDKVFFCGGGAFSAAALKGVSIFDCHEVYSYIGENYLKDFEQCDIRNYDLCQYCSYNKSIRKHLKEHKHKMI